MEGLKGGVELTYIIADMLKIHLEISADGFSEYFAKYHIKEHEAAAEWVFIYNNLNLNNTF